MEARDKSRLRAVKRTFPIEKPGVFRGWGE